MIVEWRMGVTLKALVGIVCNHLIFFRIWPLVFLLVLYPLYSDGSTFPTPEPRSGRTAKDDYGRLGSSTS
jgi:hypothetical protein